MTSFDVVERVLAIEGAVLVLALIVIFWHALAMRSDSAARGALLGRGRTLLYAGLQSGAMDDAAVEELRRFRRTFQIRLFADLAPSLTGKDRQWLGDIADRVGLVAYARRRARSRFWWRRLNAARLLTLFSRSDDTMSTLARDSHELVRAQAAEAFGHAPSDEGIETLLELLGDPRRIVRFMARDSLVRIGRPAHAAIADAIPRASERAIDALLSVAATSPSHDFASALAPLVRSPRAATRAGAADALRAIGGADASALLSMLLDDSDTKVRVRAVDGLASLGFWPAAPAIARLLDADDWQLRYRAAVALQNLGGPGELLLRRVADGEGHGAAIARRVVDAAAQLRAEAV